MKQTGKKLLALVLAAVMVFALGVTAFAATADNVQQYGTYVCLGDSIAAGFGDYAPTTYCFERVPAAYHSIVADAVGAELIPMAHVGTRTEELRWLLEDDFEGDEVCMSFNGMNYYDGWLSARESADEPNPGYSDAVYNALKDYYGPGALQQYYRDQVQKADLITLEVGENDIILYAALQTMTVLSEETESPYVAKMKELMGQPENYGQALNILFQTANTVHKLGSVVQTLLEKMNHGYQHFFQNWEPLIQDLHRLSPDATVVVVGLYNPMNETKLLEGDLLTVGKLVDALVVGANAFMAQNASRLNYRFADVMGTDLLEVPPLTDSGYISRILTACHPSEEGHKQIAEKILSVLPTEQPMSFFDVPKGAWFYDGVYYAWANGLMNGMTEHLFVPVEIASRAQIATVLYRMAGSPDVSSMTEPFADVADSFWAHDAIVWAYNSGVVNGMGDNLFAPLAPVSRAQFVTMLYRYAGSPDVTGESAPFIDAADAHWAHDAIVWAYSTGAVTGVTAHTFVPAGAVTRAQIAVILARYQGAAA